MSDTVLTTSPLLFAYRGRDGRLAAMDARGGPRFRLSSARAAELAVAFLDGCTVAEALEHHGIAADEIAQARDVGILVDAERAPAADWEHNGWSRAAYLFFSQMDIPYLESDAAMSDRAAITDERRAAVSDYQDDDPYPTPQLIATGASVALPEPEVLEPTLTALTDRGSVRAFSPRPPSAEQLGAVLWAATEPMRLVAHDRRTGDAFRLLNSLYSWAHPYVVVQDVDGIAAGIHEYDWRTHTLVATGQPAPADDALLACAQGQRWVLGPGFVVFVVADLRGYAWLYRHSRAYLHLLMQVGELGQELLMAATVRGLGGWTTPAIAESAACALLGLPDDDGLDVLSLVKLARPRA